jgi:hypothetical protein
MKLDYYESIPQLHAAARRERAQAIAHFVGLAFAWLATRGKTRSGRVAPGRTLARGW